MNNKINSLKISLSAAIFTCFILNVSISKAMEEKRIAQEVTSNMQNENPEPTQPDIKHTSENAAPTKPVDTALTDHQGSNEENKNEPDQNPTQNSRFSKKKIAALLGGSGMLALLIYLILGNNNEPKTQFRKFDA